MKITNAIMELHEKCAVYTAIPTANRLLDEIAWDSSVNLSSAVLLEPCVGEGAILKEAIERLFTSFKKFDIELTFRNLKNRIIGYEFHAPTAEHTKGVIRQLLTNNGLHFSSAKRIANYWIRCSDFLLEPPERVSHIVANPPYLRWSKLPVELSEKYRNELDPIATRGDISLAFLNQMLTWASLDAEVSVLVTDRWLFAQYGEAFRSKIADDGWYTEVVDERPENAFAQDVGAYAAIVKFSKKQRVEPGRILLTRRTKFKNHLEQLLARYGDITNSGCLIRVGPALGSGTTFVFENRDLPKVEIELVRPYVAKQHLNGTIINETCRSVVCPYDSSGSLISLADFPKFTSWVETHRNLLSSRSFVKNDADKWWRTIDAIGPIWNDQPKLLVPEMSKELISTIDTSGGIPGHSIYAIFSKEWPINALQSVLNAGLLRLTAEAEAPKLEGGWFRFYKRFLVRIPLPKWNSLDSEQKAAFLNSDSEKFGNFFADLFDFPAHSLLGNESDELVLGTP